MPPLSLKQSMELAGRCLLAWLDPSHGYLPTGGWLVSHDTGRWWDAMLRLEAAIGFPIPGELEGAMLRNFARLTDNPDRLLLIPREGAGGMQPTFELHSLREGLLACWALCRYRSSAWAADVGRAMVKTIDRCLTPEATWDLDRFLYPAYAGVRPPGAETLEAGGDMTGSSGRCIEALVLFHETTGDPLALSLASRFVEYHLRHSVDLDGGIPEHLRSPANSGHTHSYLGTLRGILLYGLFTGETEPVERVGRAYSVAVPALVHESGWAAHDLGKLRFPDATGNPVGENASTGDAAQIGLWLATRTGFSEGFADVERLVRARLLPAQIVPEDGVTDPRKLGGWGVHGLPHARKGSILDVAAAVLHSLTDIWGSVCVWTPQNIRVNLHFDYSDDQVRVTHQRASGTTGTATTIVKAQDDCNLSVRLPPWAAREELRFTVDGRPVKPWRVGGYAFFRRARLPGKERSTRAVSVEFPLASRETVETLPNGDTCRFGWHGDEIAWTDPNPGPLPYYGSAPRALGFDTPPEVR